MGTNDSGWCQYAELVVVDHEWVDWDVMETMFWGGGRYTLLQRS